MELRRSEFAPYYSGFANGALWPLFHYMPSKFRFRSDERDAYEEINRQFARNLLPLLRSDDLIWVHDYHLIPLGARLRDLGVRSPIGFFLHIPFPHIEVLRILPSHAELIRDLASYDLLGFQTQGDLTSFRFAVSRTFGVAAPEGCKRVVLGDRTVSADVFPIGIDVDAVHEQAASARHSVGVRRMIDSLLGRKLMIGVDRLDYSKGLIERFAAYEQFLEAFPENRGRVTYLQVAPLSRNDVHSYVEIRRALEQATGRTNGRFADTDWTPIRYVNRNLPHGDLMGFLRAANVGLVTALRDGMNLVAKEYVAAQDAEDPGVLILSNLAGAACELDAAVLINPHDARAVGHAIQSALQMSLVERRDRHARLMAVLRSHDIAAWTDGFLAALQATDHAAG
jgi:trehalose 6-phosphate synthase